MRACYLAVLTLGAAMVVLVPARAADTNPATTSDSGAGLERARASIDDMEYQKAVEILAGVVESDPREADAYNLLGFSHRKLKNFDEAERNYKRALRLEPEHRGALEYIGELYIETDRRAQAEEMLAKLEAACPQGCNELEDLKAALAGKRTTSSW